MHITGIRCIAQHYDASISDISQESILRDEKLSKASTLKELSYLHVEQMDFLK